MTAWCRACGVACGVALTRPVLWRCQASILLWRPCCWPPSCSSCCSAPSDHRRSRSRRRCEQLCGACLPHAHTHAWPLGLLTATAPSLRLPLSGSWQEIDALCTEWQPEPLVPRLTEAQQPQTEHIIAGCAVAWGRRGATDNANRLAGTIPRGLWRRPARCVPGHCPRTQSFTY